MFDNLKIYLIEVGIKKIVPSLIKGGLAALVGLLAAHNGLLSSLGVTYDTTGQVISFNLSAFSHWLEVIALSGTLTGTLTALFHHTGAAVTGTPQSGDVRKENNIPTPGGERETDK